MGSSGYLFASSPECHRDTEGGDDEGCSPWKQAGIRQRKHASVFRNSRFAAASKTNCFLRASAYTTPYIFRHRPNNRTAGCPHSRPGIISASTAPEKLEETQPDPAAPFLTYWTGLTWTSFPSVLQKTLLGTSHPCLPSNILWHGTPQPHRFFNCLDFCRSWGISCRQLLSAQSPDHSGCSQALQ